MGSVAPPPTVTEEYVSKMAILTRANALHLPVANSAGTRKTPVVCAVVTTLAVQAVTVLRTAVWWTTTVEYAMVTEPLVRAVMVLRTAGW